MTTELWMLLASAVLMQAMPFIYGPGFIKALGQAKMIGNRDEMPAVEGWFARAKRGHANMAENLLPFAAVVLVAHAADAGLCRGRHLHLGRCRLGGVQRLTRPSRAGSMAGLPGSRQNRTSRVARLTCSKTAPSTTCAIDQIRPGPAAMMPRLAT